MNKAEKVRRYTRHTVEQERDLQQKRMRDIRKIKEGITAMMETILMIIQNQAKIANLQKEHLPQVLEIQKQNTVMAVYQKTMK